MGCSGGKLGMMKATCEDVEVRNGTVSSMPSVAPPRLPEVPSLSLPPALSAPPILAPFANQPARPSSQDVDLTDDNKEPLPNVQTHMLAEDDDDEDYVEELKTAEARRRHYRGGGRPMRRSAAERMTPEVRRLAAAEERGRLAAAQASDFSSRTERKTCPLVLSFRDERVIPESQRLTARAYGPNGPVHFVRGGAPGQWLLITPADGEEQKKEVMDPAPSAPGRTPITRSALYLAVELAVIRRRLDSITPEVCQASSREDVAEAAGYLREQLNFLDLALAIAAIGSGGNPQVKETSDSEVTVTLESPPEDAVNSLELDGEHRFLKALIDRFVSFAAPELLGQLRGHDELMILKKN